MILQVVMLVGLYLWLDGSSHGCYNEQSAVDAIRLDVLTERLASRSDDWRLGPHPERDMWGTPYLVVRLGDGVAVISAGPDGWFATGDDVISGEGNNDGRRARNAQWWPRPDRYYGQKP